VTVVVEQLSDAGAAMLTFGVAVLEVTVVVTVFVQPFDGLVAVNV
jgi:hypothetical protein